MQSNFLIMVIMSFTKTRLALRSLVFTVSKDAYTPCFHALCVISWCSSVPDTLWLLSPFSSGIRKEAKQSVSLATFLLPSLTLSSLWTGVFLCSKTMKSLSSGQLGHNWLFQSRTLQNTKLWRLAYFQSSFWLLVFPNISYCYIWYWTWLGTVTPRGWFVG